MEYLKQQRNELKGKQKSSKNDWEKQKQNETDAEKEMNLDFVLAIFKLRLVSMLGFMPNIKMCKNCKTTENLTYFSIKDNTFKCELCGKQDSSCIQMQEGTRDAIRYSILAPSEKLYSFQIPDDCKKELELIAKVYFNEKLEKEYKMDEF